MPASIDFMRLNDPKIELVHDDPFMGYINESNDEDDEEVARINENVIDRDEDVVIILCVD